MSKYYNKIYDLRIDPKHVIRITMHGENIINPDITNMFGGDILILCLFDNGEELLELEGGGLIELTQAIAEDYLLDYIIIALKNEIQLFTLPLNVMPIYINKDGLPGKIAKWRLEHGI